MQADTTCHHVLEPYTAPLHVYTAGEHSVCTFTPEVFSDSQDHSVREEQPFPFCRWEMEARFHNESEVQDSLSPETFPSPKHCPPHTILTRTLRVCSFLRSPPLTKLVPPWAWGRRWCPHWGQKGTDPYLLPAHGRRSHACWSSPGTQGASRQQPPAPKLLSPFTGLVTA